MTFSLLPIVFPPFETVLFYLGRFRRLIAMILIHRRECEAKTDAYPLGRDVGQHFLFRGLNLVTYVRLSKALHRYQ